MRRALRPCLSALAMLALLGRAAHAAPAPDAPSDASPGPPKEGESPESARGNSARDGSDKIAQARDAFTAGVTRFQNGDLAGALEQFKAADRLHHAPEITYNIGRVHEGLGHAQAAVDAYEAYLAESGADARFSSAATLAIAQIRGRTTRLRVESTPPDARVYVDGVPVRDRTPVTVLVFRGPHQVILELGDWQQVRSYDAVASKVADTLTFVRPKAPPPHAAQTAPRQLPAEPPAAPELSGLMGGISLSISGFWFVGTAKTQNANEVTTADSQAAGLVFGLSAELGYALGPKVALVARGFGSLGSTQGELAALGAASLTASWRSSERWWLGAGGVAGANRADTDATTRSSSLVDAHSSTITYQTDFAVGPMLELGYALGQNEDGQWIVSVMPGLLLTTSSQYSSLFVPLLIGHRWL